MTMLVSAAGKSLITMSADVAVTRVDQSGIPEYDTGRKTYDYPGYGVVGTWGQRDGINNTLDRFIRSELQGTTGSVDYLKDAVWKFLQDEFQPRARDPLPNDVGFHVGGFDVSGKPCLYHAYWNLGADGQDGHCTLENQSPGDQECVRYLYNGLPEVVNALLNSLVAIVNRGSEAKFNLGNPVDMARFGDLLCRVASELTPEVGPPFHTYVVAPGNRIERITNLTLAPLDAEKVALTLRVIECK